MATAKFNSKSPTIRRILREAQEISSSPSPDYTATPLETDLFEWHFTLRGPPDSVYAEGLYHGRIVLPPSYPLRPPSFRFLTPSGRFEANREICLSISGHHEETWQPAWGVRTALVALRSFMETDPRGQLGGLETTDAVRRRLAAESRGFRCATCNKANSDIIAEAEEAAREWDAKRRAKEGGEGGEASGSGSSAEVVVPPELKMAWRDELSGGSGIGSPSAGTATPTTSSASTTAPATAAAAVTTSDENDPEIAELAEGFVQTVPAPTAATAAAAAAAADTGSSTSVSVAPRPHPALQPTRTAATRLPTPHHHQPPPAVTAAPVPGRPNGAPQIRHQQQQQLLPRQQQRRQFNDDGVPAWVDRAIIIVAIMLLFMLIKVIMA